MKVFSLVLLAAALQGATAGREIDVRAGYTIEPESLRVGDPGILRIRVLAPAGARVIFPGAIDSTAAVEPLDPVVVHEETKDGRLESVGTYRFVAWELGLPLIEIGAIRVEHGGAVRELRVGDARVSVLTVLPEDTTQRVPKPSRDIASLPVSHWAAWMLAGVAAFIVAMLAIWWRQRGKRPPVPTAPIVAAKKAFGRLDALDLISAGEPAKHVAASADILRTYLAARDPAASQGLTTAELIAVLRGDGAVPVDRVEALLTIADAIKFSGESIDGPGAERVAAEAAAIVSEIHRADMHQTKRKKKS